MTTSTTGSPLSQCVDSVCWDGVTSCVWYEPLDSRSQCQCRSPGGCSISACLTNASCVENTTCYDEWIHYRCICSSIHCRQINSSLLATVGGLSLAVGIKAGGAKCRVIGNGLSTTQLLGAYFTNSQLPVIYGRARSGGIIVAPRVNNSYIGEPFEVYVEYAGPIRQIVPLNFTFTEDPHITDINPKQQLVTGGVYLTVSGTLLDVVRDPVMNITVVIRYQSPNFTNVEIYSLSSVCELNTSDNMLCMMPPLNLPLEFEQSNDTRREGSAVATLRFGFGDDVPSSRSVAAQDANRLISDSPVRQGVANVYVGFQFDDFPDYSNISVSNPEIYFTLLPYQGHFEKSDPIVFDPEANKPLIIKGQKFDVGCSHLDYRLTLSNDTNCTIQDFTSNQILCSPPLQKPAVNDMKSIYCQDAKTLPLMAKIGQAPDRNIHFVYCVKYKDSLPLALIIGLTVGLGGGCLIIIIIVVVCCCIRRHQRAAAAATDGPRPRLGIINQVSPNYYNEDNGSQGDMSPQSFGTNYSTRIPDSETDSAQVLFNDDYTGASFGRPQPDADFQRSIPAAIEGFSTRPSVSKHDCVNESYPESTPDYHNESRLQDDVLRPQGGMQPVAFDGVLPFRLNPFRLILFRLNPFR